MAEKNADKSQLLHKTEFMLFFLMEGMEMQEEKLAGIFTCFFKEYRRQVFDCLSDSCTTARVTRMARCLFYALAKMNTTENEKKAMFRKIFHDIFMFQSSEAVCQSLVYLLAYNKTRSFASEILKTELNDESIISMHISAYKDVDVLKWAIDRFADDSSKTLATSSFRTPAIPEMVLKWWEEFLKRMINDFISKKMGNFFLSFLSHHRRIEGVDKVKFLEQIYAPAIEKMRRVTPVESVMARVSARIYMAESDASVVAARMRLSVHALTRIYFYGRGQYSAEQREGIRRHLINSIEKVQSILERPVCYTVFKQTYKLNQQDGLPEGVTAIKKWADKVEKLLEKEEKGTPAGAQSGPVKKRARVEEDEE